MAVLFSALARSFPKNIEGPAQWQAGLLLFALAYLLFGTQDSIDNSVGLILANITLLVGLILINAGLRRFFDGSKTYKLSSVIGFLLLYFAALVWFTYIELNSFFTMLVFTIGTAIIIIDTLVLLLRNIRYGSGVIVIAISFALPLLTRILRTVGILVGADMPTHMLDPTPTQLIFLAVPMLAMPIGTIGFLWLISQHLIQQIKDLNRHDDLTSCLKRNVFNDELTREINRAARTKRPLCVMMIDLDNFKRVNDNHGHKRGDDVLSSAASELKLAIRKTDFIGRYGGDEFCITLPETDAAAAEDVAKRILLLSENVEAKNLGISFSIGIAELTDPSEPPEALLSRADEALYRAKSAGKSQLTISPPIKA